jgi:IS5 family transposase
LKEHTEAIRKGKAGKPTEFGKMIKMQEAEHQIITDYQVFEKQPVDADLLLPSIETHQKLLGRFPRWWLPTRDFSAPTTRERLRKRESRRSRFPTKEREPGCLATSAPVPASAALEGRV